MRAWQRALPSTPPSTNASPGLRAVAALALALTHAALVVGGVLPRYDALLFVPMASLFAWLTVPLSRRVGLALTMAFFVAVGASSFAHQLWTGLEGRHALVGGIIPWSDAEGFLSNTWRLVHGLPLSTPATLTAMRPLYPLSLAGVMSLTGFDLRAALGVFGLVAALLMGAVSRELGARYGWRALAVVLVVFAFFLRRYLFVVATEALAAIAGLVAFRLLLAATPHGGRTLRGGPLLPVAFLCLGVALLARPPGPLVALPLLVVWIARRAEARGRRLAFLCALSLGAAAIANASLIRSLGDGFGRMGGEFPPVLYGAVHGEQFTYLGEVHRDVADLPQAERMNATLRLLGREIAERPWLVFGIFRSAGSFVAGPHGTFSVIHYAPDDTHLEGSGTLGERARRLVDNAGLYRALNLIFMATLGGLYALALLRESWRAARAWRRGTLSRVGEAALLVFAGTVSAAFLTPPWITESAQLQASTLSFMAVLPWIARADERMATAGAHPRASEAGESPRWLALAPAVGLLAWLAASFAACLVRKSDVPKGACDTPRAFFFEPSTAVTVGEAGYTMARAQENLRMVGKHNGDLVDSLRGDLAPGFTVALAFDGCAGRAAAWTGPSAMRSMTRAWSRPSATPVDARGRVFRVDVGSADPRRGVD